MIDAQSRVRRLSDGTRIHVMGTVQKADFIWCFRNFEHDTFELLWSRNKQVHFTVRKIVEMHRPDVMSWLRDHNTCTTYWVDPAVFEQPDRKGITIQPIDDGTVYASQQFDYGVGFRPNDPVETAFMLRWA